MKINIVTVGSLKEKYLSDGCKEYLKRISRFHTIKIIEVEEEKQQEQAIITARPKRYG